MTEAHLRLVAKNLSEDKFTIFDPLNLPDPALTAKERARSKKWRGHIKNGCKKC